jgi:hypothetical protein
MVRKILVVCSVLMLLGASVYASPVSQGKMVISAPVISVNNILGLGGYDTLSFGDNGSINVLGNYGTTASLGYFLIDNIEVGARIGYYHPMNDLLDPSLSVGLFGRYYLDMGGLLPFAGLTATLVDVTGGGDLDMRFGIDVGAAYALSSVIAPYASLNFIIDEGVGSLLHLSIGLKFFF